MARRSARARTEAMPMEESVSPVEAFLCDLRETRATGAGVAETSYYPALANLFNSIGQSLKPRVRCVMNLRNLGAGMPDGGLFTADQFERQTDLAPRQGQTPARGAIEAKGPGEEADRIVGSQQVRDYLDRYGIVIVTNLREFRIVERGGSGGGSARGVEGGADAGADRPSGDPIEREAFKLAEDEEEFWRERVAHPVAAARELGGQFIEFIKRACLHAAPLVNPRDVAWFLASYARDALARVERRKDLPALQTVRKALEDALGMRFTDEQGEHFFRSTLVQTIFYGVFSAWVLWHRDNLGPPSAFDWEKAAKSLHVPFIRALYWQLADPRHLKELDLGEVLEWAGCVLNRVEVAEFFTAFNEADAVQYFYEPFLEAYDPRLRKQLGVWYTPREIVKYQVARVDAVLREELGLPDGLADPNVVVLDPCCGTGAYLVEVLHRIADTLRQKGGDSLVASELKKCAMERVFGFEILPAPFVVSHLQLGLMLRVEGAPLSHIRDERVGVYLTNALTGWEPPTGVKATPVFIPELQTERDAAEQIKRTQKILVVLGNPPYNAFAGVSPEEEQGLVEPYKKGLNKPIAAGGWGIKKFNLDDLYIRFFRLAERRIAEMTGKGVVSFISNNSYLSDPSFVVMRQQFMGEFDKLWFDCMNGDSRETGKLTPEGLPDPSVFSTLQNREGIRVGTAVCVIVRKSVREKKPLVRFRHFWGVNKRIELLDSLNRKRFDAAYTRSNPAVENRFSFEPEDVTRHYAEWPKLTDLCAVPPFNGPVERRANSLIQITNRVSEFDSVRAYLDPSVNDEEIHRLEPRFMLSSGEFNAVEARMRLKGKVKYDPKLVARYPFKPLDVRYAYLDPEIQPLFSRPSPHLLNQRFPGNAFFISRDTADKSPEGPPFYFSKLVCDYDSISGHARHFPLLLKNGSRLEKTAEATLFSLLGEAPEADEPVANLSAHARTYLHSLKLRSPDASERNAGLIWFHALAIGFSPAFLSENADGVRRDWPRVPLPISRKSLESSAGLGEQLAILLDNQCRVDGISKGQPTPKFKRIGLISKVGGGQLNPDKGEIALSVGWGHSGKGGAVMPGKGRVVERAFDEDELAAIREEAKARRMSADDAVRLLGGRTLDVHLNGKAYWRNVPVSVWDYTIGGYQVVKKWLSYREEAILGRTLTPDEVREVTDIVRRLTAIVLLQPQLDANYNAVKAATYAWPMDT